MADDVIDPAYRVFMSRIRACKETQSVLLPLCHARTQGKYKEVGPH